MIRRLLIANRGECAARITRSCLALGITPIRLYTSEDPQEAEQSSAKTSGVTEWVKLSSSYLDGEAIIQAALQKRAEAIHPGWGFLSENPEFAESVTRSGLHFVGPSAKTLTLCGSKESAKVQARQHGIPVIPGCSVAEDRTQSIKDARQLGYPLMLKAAFGGGGRGMRLVEEEAAFQTAVESAKREAQSAFGDPSLLLEKVIYKARHIEVQLLGDKYGNRVHLHDRECSLQRRNQKIIEEAPAPHLKQTVREKLHQTALKLAEIIELENAATVEFLLDSENQYYFLEVNPRLQVEHPVTEEILGLDLVEWQIRITSGEELSLPQSDPRGTAIEARIYAENPARDFHPTEGKFIDCRLPDTPGELPRGGHSIRVDHSMTLNMLVNHNFDPMLGKIICHSDKRQTALAHLEAALGETFLPGVITNIPFLKQLLSLLETQTVHTQTIDQQLDGLLKGLFVEEIVYDACALWLVHEYFRQNYSDPFFESPYWRSSQLSMPEHTVLLSALSMGRKEEVALRLVAAHQKHNKLMVEAEIDNKPHSTIITLTQDSTLLIRSRTPVLVRGDSVWLGQHCFRFTAKKKASDEQGDERPALLAPLPGSVSKVLKSENDSFEAGETLIFIESMKMEHPLAPSIGGTVQEIFVREGDTVSEGQVLLSYVAFPTEGP